MTENLNALYEKLGAMDSKLDAIMHIGGKHDERLNSHSKRIASVEKRQNWFLGLGAGIGVAFTTAITMIKANIFG